MAAPKGFKKVETQVVGFWKPEKEGQSIRGTVSHAIETKGLNGQPNKFFLVRVDVEEYGGPVVTAGGKNVKVKPGQLVGVGGKTVLAFLNNNIEKEVFLEYQGLGEPKKGQNAPKLYAMYVAE